MNEYLHFFNIILLSELKCHGYGYVMHFTMYQHLLSHQDTCTYHKTSSGRGQLVASHRAYARVVSESSGLPNNSIASIISSNSC